MNVLSESLVALSGRVRRWVLVAVMPALLAVVLAVGLPGAGSPAHAADGFVVEDIRLEGLRRLSPGTVFNALPISIGDSVDSAAIANAIRALFASGFFQDVSVGRDGSVLVVDVVERPAIARVELFGNEELDEDLLMQTLRGVGLAEGESFDPALLDSVRAELRSLYLGRGYYTIEVESTISPLPRNRVGVRIDITEGDLARIRSVQFVGNTAFTDRQLRRIMELGPRPWYLPLSRRDRYAAERLSGDIERVLRRYRDAGYVTAEVTSTQVALTPDRRGLLITINLDEGGVYRFGDVELVGNLIVPESELMELVAIRSGERFSQSALTETADAIRERLGAEGYAFASVNPVPDLDDDNNVADVGFFIDPGSRVYVRRIEISGNLRTNDEVIRREFRQMEGGWYSNELLRTSRTRLNQLGFFDSVEIEPRQVSGSPDQVDIDVTVEEGLAGSLQLGIGYGSGSGFLIDLSLSQDNVLGSGDRLDLVLARSDDTTIYRFDYTDRYYTIDGVTRHFAGSYEDSNLARRDITDYQLRTASARVGLGYPVSETTRVRGEVGFEDIRLDPGGNAAALVLDFERAFGSDFQNALLYGSIRRNSVDRRIFPTSGSTQDFNVQLAVPGSDLTYYKLDYTQRSHFRLPADVTLQLYGRASHGDGYGDFDRLPFLQNFFTGGPRSVRGYRISSLGPQDERGRAIGGDTRLNASAEAFFPLPGDVPSVRLSTFVDSGQVYALSDDSLDLGDLRYSAGLGLVWMSPIGPLTISRAWPLNEEPGDRLDRFQFAIGTFF